MNRHGNSCLLHDLFVLFAHLAAVNLIALFISVLILKLAYIASPFSLSVLDSPSNFDSPAYNRLRFYFLVLRSRHASHLLLSFNDARGSSRSLASVRELCEGLSSAGETFLIVHLLNVITVSN